MVIRFDAEARAAYISLASGTTSKTEDLGDGFAADYSRSGKLLGVEILHVELEADGRFAFEIPARIRRLLLGF